jgi:hypothetical protein
MENPDAKTATDRLELIARSRQRASARLHSSLAGYVALGVLWATPIAVLGFSRAWAVFTVLPVVAITVLWSRSLTRRRGITPARVDPSSVAAKLGAWLLIGWVICALAAFVTSSSLVSIISAFLAAALVAVLGSRIDRAVLQEATATVGQA